MIDNTQLQKMQEIVKLQNNNVSAMNKERGMFKAIEKGSVKEVRDYIEKGVNVKAIAAHDDGTALHCASRKGYKELCKILLEGGAEVNAKDIDGLTALHWAGERGHTETCKVLIDGGADVNVQDKGGLTALHWAVGNGNRETCKVLADGGGKVNVKDNNGMTAQDWAIQIGWEDILCMEGQIGKQNLS